MAIKTKYSRVELRALYSLAGEYITFRENPLNGRVFENVDVCFRQEARKIGDTRFKVDVIEIEGEDPIDCELVSRYKRRDGTLLIELCQDWG